MTPVIRLKQLPDGSLQEEKQQSHDEQSAFEAYTNTKMFQAVKPLFITLRIFGLFYSKDYGSVEQCMQQAEKHKQGQHYSKSKPKRFHVSASRVYSWIVCIIIAVFTAKSALVFNSGNFSFGPDLLSKLSFATWVAVMAANCVMFMRASSKFEGIPQFFIQWDMMLVDRDDVQEWIQNVRRHTWVIMLVTWIFMSVGISFMILGAFKEPELIFLQLAPYGPDDPEASIMTIFVVIFIPYLMAVWILPASLDFMLCHGLCKFFMAWRDNFRRKCLCGISTEEFIIEHQKFHNICKLVSHGDEVLSMYKATSLLGNAANMLFLLYNLIFLAEHTRIPVVLAATCTWFLWSFIILMIALIGGAMVNTMVSTFSINCLGHYLIRCS